MRLDVMSQVKTAFTSLVSRSDEQGTVGKAGTGTLGGATVRMASTATQPAHAGGIGERLKAAFAPLTGAFKDAKAWLQAKMQPAEQAPTFDKGKTIVQIKNRIEYTALNHNPDFAAKNALTPSIRGAITHAYGQELMEKFVKSSDHVSSAASFMRDNNSISKIAANIALKSPTMDAVAINVRNIIGDTPVVLSKASIGIQSEDSESKTTKPTHPILASQVEKGGTLDRRAIADASVTTIDRVMVELFGDPDDPASIEAAVDRYPQELCDHLAIMNNFITEAEKSIGTDMANQLKKTCGRDIFVLRVVNPTLTARPGIAEKDSPEMKGSIVSVSKAVQNLANGFGVGGSKNEASTEIDEAGEDLNMQERWTDGFEKFLAVASTRANQTNLDRAAADAPQLIATRDRLVAELDELKA